MPRISNFSHRSLTGAGITSVTNPWTVSSLHGSWGTNTINDIYWNSTLSHYIAIGNSGCIATSSNGSSWTFQGQLSGTAWGTQPVLSIGWDGSQYLIGGGTNGTTPYLATSPNGATWTLVSTNLATSGWSTGPVRSIIHDGFKWVIGGGDYTSARIANSPDGTSWTNYSNPLGNAWVTTIVRNTANNMYYYGGYVTYCCYSTDAVLFTADTTLSTAWGGNSFTPYASILDTSSNVFIVGGDSGKLATTSSTASPNFTNQAGLTSTSWGSNTVRKFIRNSGTFIAVGDSGRVATSTNGTSWTYKPLLSSSSWALNNVNTIATNGSKFVVGGANGKIAVSKDTTTI